ncbi:transcriptional regulator [Halorubrum sp. Atlit-8R]|uniref:HVO_A0114 family putative DNA-binding protein n=1 Tax=unclassified Halorubrum TaxID=2642239 RepID=UPI000EF1A89F|nr:MULTISPECIES: transcriptional regulator [unclassified Halorubrum]RLM72215.1 transcriptional regulator [Halorubrum sp. Atlit-9R]RLM82232.1 transcriptional regulator [Halorubrum sp. Atlit-8R]
MTTLHITVGDQEQLRQDALQFVRDVDADDIDSQDGTARLQFGTYDDFVDSLTPLRLELIRAMAERTPESMRKAARLVDRDVSDIYTDLKQLEVLGILTLEAGGPVGAIQPLVPFDRIEIHIDYPLIDRDGADSATANA